MFTDDTSINIQGNNIHEMEIAMNSEIRLSIWLKINKLSLNIKKPHTMIFSNMKSAGVLTLNIYVVKYLRILAL